VSNRLRSAALKQRESAQRFNYRQQGKELVRRRWEAGGRKCEGCGEVVDIVEVAHLASRAGHIIPDRIASRAELMAALCCVASYGDRAGCHESIDGNRDPDLLERLRWQAVARLCAATSLPISSTVDHDALGALRSLAHVLEAQATA
jgi:hypothetical protein